MIHRRHLVFGLAGAVGAPIPARSKDLPVVCYLALATRAADATGVAAFLDGMRELGHAPEQTFHWVELYADGDPERADAMLRAQLRRPVAVVLAPGPVAARLALRATRAVPVAAVGLHPRGGQSDLFDSLARPGGMVTGVSSFGEALSAKRIQLLRELMPRLSRVGVLHNTTDPVFRRWGDETDAQLREQGLAAMRVGLRSASRPALQQALRDARSDGAEAIMAVRDFLTSALHEPISQMCRAFGLALVGEERRYALAGALMSYGASVAHQFRLVATYVDRLLAGANPALLPIEQPTRFELVVNLGTAKALGLPVPASMRLRADELIG